jgi:hypothetical protein
MALRLLALLLPLPPVWGVLLANNAQYQACIAAPASCLNL